MMSLQIVFFLLAQHTLSTESLSRPFEKWRRRTTALVLPEEITDHLSLAATRKHIHLVSNERIINKIFDGADSNHDGLVDFEEVYELILKILITVNRKVPIPPPSKQRVMQLFLNADTTHNNKLNRIEFQGLANILVRRLALRVVVHKLVTVVGAPLLAESVLRACTRVEWLASLAKMVVPDRLEERLLPIITSPAFWRTILVIVFVSTLGNVVIECVNSVMENSLENNEKNR